MISNIKQYTEAERKQLKKEGYTDFDISMDLVSVMKDKERRAKVTREQWDNAKSTCMK